MLSSLEFTWDKETTYLARNATENRFCEVHFGHILPELNRSQAYDWRLQFDTHSQETPACVHLGAAHHVNMKSAINNN